MNPQALHGPVSLSPEFQHLECNKRFDVLMQISKSVAKRGTIGVWKWFIYNNILHVMKMEK